MTPDRDIKGCPVAVLDTETTGLDPDVAHVVDVAVVHTEIGGADAVVAFSSLVRPPVAIPADSTRITGIDDQTVASAPRWAEVAERVAAACEGRLVVAYNAPFDYRIVRAENERANLPTPAWPWLDLLVVRKATKPRGRPGRLAEIAIEYGILLDAHGAAGDALTTSYLLTPMLRTAWTVGALRSERISEMLAWQRRAALAQEQEYAAYCRRRGDAYPPSCAWHEIEGEAAPSWAPPVRAVACDGCTAAIVWSVDRDGGRTALDATTRKPHDCPAQGAA